MGPSDFFKKAFDGWLKARHGNPMRSLSLALVWGVLSAFGILASPQVDPLGQAQNLPAGMESGISGVALTLNEATGRIEVRNAEGLILDEVFPGTVGKVVDVAEQEYRLSFGRDDWDRPSLIVRPGPAMRRPVSLQVLGRKAVLSPEASLLATIYENQQVSFEPSICGTVYYIEEVAGTGTAVSRLASGKKEVAVLAQPAHPGGVGPGSGPIASSRDDGKGMEKAGESVKSAFYTLFGLPDKQPSGKAKVYRLRSQDGGEAPAEVAPPVSAQAGRPTTNP